MPELTGENTNLDRAFELVHSLEGIGLFKPCTLSSATGVPLFTVQLIPGQVCLPDNTYPDLSLRVLSLNPKYAFRLLAELAGFGMITCMGEEDNRCIWVTLHRDIAYDFWSRHGFDQQLARITSPSTAEDDN